VLSSQSLQQLFPVTVETEVESNIVGGSSYDHLGMTEENISHEGLRYIAGYIANHTKNKKIWVPTLSK
jgi:hypothetical protein